MEFQPRIRLHRGYGATGYSDYSDGTRKGGTKAGVLTSFLLSTLPNYPCNPRHPRFNFRIQRAQTLFVDIEPSTAGRLWSARST